LIILALVAWFVVRAVRNRNTPVPATAGTKRSVGAVAARRPNQAEVRVNVKPAAPAQSAVPAAPPKRRSSRGYQPPHKNGRTPPEAH
jgi:hypothetical protein